MKSFTDDIENCKSHKNENLGQGHILQVLYFNQLYNQFLKSIIYSSIFVEQQQCFLVTENKQIQKILNH